MKHSLLVMALVLLAGTAGAEEAGPENSRPETRSLGISYASLSFRGIASNRFNPMLVTLEARLTGSVFGTRPDDVSLVVNDLPVPAAELRVADDFVSARISLRSGLNEVVLTALDQHGALIAADVLAWAGDRQLAVDVVDTDLQAIENAEVELVLADDHHVRLSATTVAARADFRNLPSEPLLLRVRGPGDMVARTVVLPEQTSVLVRLSAE